MFADRSSERSYHDRFTVTYRLSHKNLVYLCVLITHNINTSIDPFHEERFLFTSDGA